MRKFSFSLLLVAMAMASKAQQPLVNKVTAPAEWVNPLMGTDSRPSLSNGNTYPATGVPWGMNYWCPQTGKNGDGWMYTYSAEKIRGFKQTHQPSPWMNDYGQFSIMPVSGLKIDENARASWFSHKAEISKPYYYSVYLADHDVTAEMVPTERAAQFRFTFPESDSSFIVIDAFDKGSYVKIIPAERKIIGYTTRYSRGKYENFKNYFVVVFNKDFNISGTWNDNRFSSIEQELKSDHAIAVVGFNTRKGETIIAKVASSFISPQQAALNLTRETGNDNFETTKQKAQRSWNKILGAIEVEGGTTGQVKTYYSCLYRAVMFPNKLYELDAQNRPVHWSPYNGKILPGYMFAGTGFWDTFRALYPLLNLVYPHINKEMQEGLVNDFKEGGWLPEWSSPGYANIMIGNNSASVVADAYIKGLRGYDIETLWQALTHGANNEGPMEAVGRKGVEFYNRLGYVPYDVKINESAARTLEYAYDDFAIWQLGLALGKPAAEIDIYKQRSKNYQKLFDASTGLMRGKNADGNFQSPFNPYKWGDAFTEGNSWHYTWSVFQDVQGLIKLMGGKNAFVNKLDSVFTIAPVFDESYYGGVIHEIREMQIANMGQYAHGNQPIQHMIYLYNYAGEPWKTQEHVRKVLNRLYQPAPDGYCGDEDNGQTSAWYIFSAMGFYPVTPATNQYVIGAPLFRKITVHLENGKSLKIEAPQNSNENKYASKILVNNNQYTKLWFDHRELTNGATIQFYMEASPKKNGVIKAGDLPYSMTND